MTFFDANYRITDLRTEKGKIVDLGINNKHIDLSNYDENKTVTITENGIIEIIPSEDKNGMIKYKHKELSFQTVPFFCILQTNFLIKTRLNYKIRLY